MNYGFSMDLIYSMWSARDILKGQLEGIILSLIPTATYFKGIAWSPCRVSMDASMRIRFGIVHLVSTNSYLDK